MCTVTKLTPSDNMECILEVLPTPDLGTESFERESASNQYALQVSVAMKNRVMFNNSVVADRLQQ